MSEHAHMKYVEGCFRCQVALDELNEHTGGNENPAPVQPDIEELARQMKKSHEYFEGGGEGYTLADIGLEPVQPDIEARRKELIAIWNDSQMSTEDAVDWVLGSEETIHAQQATIETLRMWLKSVEWVQGQDGRLRCPLCNQQFRRHDSQCNWVEDRAALGKVFDD